MDPSPNSFVKLKEGQLLRVVRGRSCTMPLLLSGIQHSHPPFPRSCCCTWRRQGMSQTSHLGLRYPSACWFVWLFMFHVSWMTVG